jgi:hypothetical protein
MFLESLMLSNFQCFGPERTSIRFDEHLTAMIGPNASGTLRVRQRYAKRSFVCSASSVTKGTFASTTSMCRTTAKSSPNREP